jgi:hypothetical protein
MNIPPEFFRPDTPLFKVLLVVPNKYRPGRFDYVWRGHNGLTASTIEAVDELGAYIEVQAILDALRKEQLGRRWKHMQETTVDDW